MKPIPYGESNFANIVRDGSFYVDKTPFLHPLEQAGKFIVFLRPRRFGKSLWVSLMQHYYGLEHQPQFKNLFGHLAIGAKPTDFANQFLVLYFDFSDLKKNAKILLKVFLAMY
jgi:hypothetical protein